MRTFRVTGCLLLLLTALFATRAAAADYDFRFHAYPNPFVAGGDKAMYLTYYVPARGTVSAYVYDFEGNKVRTLAEGLEHIPGVYNGEIKWDGRDDNDGVVAPEPYVIVLEVRIQGKPYRDSFVAVVNR
ncbi:MAG: hypothetical protein GTN49_12420 [candidate division Zixibacteria bacterium]|nr:hypothetical protein [candidate division Zixibacteria bacterium]